MKVILKSAIGANEIYQLKIYGNSNTMFVAAASLTMSVLSESGKHVQAYKINFVLIVD